MRALAIIVAISALTGAADSDTAGRAKPAAVTPIPPTRPAELGVGSAASQAQPADGGASPAARTAAAPSPPTPPAFSQTPPQAPPQVSSQASTEADPAGATATPKTLPKASRQRMHACGVEWQKLKMTGQTIDKNWLDFAEICLSQ